MPISSQDDGPREQEDDLHVKDDENESKDVVADVELDLALADGDLAAFVGRELLRIGIVRPQELSGQQRDGDKEGTHRQEDSHTGVLVKHAAASSCLVGARRPSRIITVFTILPQKNGRWGQLSGRSRTFAL